MEKGKKVLVVAASPQIDRGVGVVKVHVSDPGDLYGVVLLVGCFLVWFGFSEQDQISSVWAVVSSCST